MLEGQVSVGLPEIGRVHELQTRLLSGARALAEPVKLAWDRFNSETGALHTPHPHFHRFPLIGTGVALLVTVGAMAGYTFFKSGEQSVPNIVPSNPIGEPAQPTAESKPVVLPPTATTEPQPTSAPATATATAKPAAGLDQEGKTFRTEKGDILNLPQIEGLTIVKEQINGKDIAFYVTTKDNPYGLPENTRAGLFYPETSYVEDKLETAKQTGSVGLRAEVIRYYLKQAGSPNQKVLAPLPFDPTFSENGKVLIQESRDSVENLGLFLSVPYGSKFVVPIESSDNELMEIGIANQAWGGATFNIGKSPLLGRFAYYVWYSTKLNFEIGKKRLGDSVFDIKVVPFPKQWYDSANTLRNPPPLTNPNFEVYGKQLYSQNGTFPRLGFSKENIMSFGNAFVFIIANDNLLLNGDGANGPKILADGSADFGKGVIGPSKADQEAVNG